MFLNQKRKSKKAKFPATIPACLDGTMFLFWLAFNRGTPFHLDEPGGEEDLRGHTIWLRNLARPGQARYVANREIQFIAKLWDIA